MITKPFDRPQPADGPGRTGWEAEKQMAFMLSRAFEHEPGVFVFNDLRLPTGSHVIQGDHVQIDHLVLHRHGMAIIESKATGEDRGEFFVDAHGQWQRRPRGQRSGYNIPSPVLQAERQRDGLRTALDAVTPPLLGKRLGLIQTRFSDVPMTVFVAIADNARVSGGSPALTERVMKAEQIVGAIRADIARLRDGDDGVWFREATTQRIVSHLLANHRPVSPASAPAPPLQTGAGRPQATHAEDTASTSIPTSSSPPSSVRPATVRPAGVNPAHAARPGPPASPPGPPAAPPVPHNAGAAGRADQPEALSCRHCKSINVGVVFRKDYCLLCEECGKYTPLEWACRGCGKPATIRKRGAEFFRACDKAGGCGREVVFWRESATRPPR